MDEASETIAAAVGYAVPDDPAKNGVIMEFHDKATREEAERAIVHMLRESFKARGWKIRDVLIGVPEPDRFLAGVFRRNFHSSLPTYWLILFVYYAFDYYGKYRDREVRALELEAQLSQASLQALKMQLNPHFLFNTLNTIAVLESACGGGGGEERGGGRGQLPDPAEHGQRRGDVAGAEVQVERLAVEHDLAVDQRLVDCRAPFQFARR